MGAAAGCSTRWSVREFLQSRCRERCSSVKGERRSQTRGCRFARSMIVFSLFKTIKLWGVWTRNNRVVGEATQLKRCKLEGLKVMESVGLKLKMRLHLEYLGPFFTRAHLCFHLSGHKSLAKTYKRYFVQWHQREKIFLENFMLLNLYRFTVLSSQINAKPQCKHLDFENFGGVSFPNSNYWFYIIFSQGSWSQPHMSLE